MLQTEAQFTIIKLFQCKPQACNCLSCHPVKYHSKQGFQQRAIKIRLYVYNMGDCRTQETDQQAGSVARGLRQEGEREREEGDRFQERISPVLSPGGAVIKPLFLRQQLPDIFSCRINKNFFQIYYQSTFAVCATTSPLSVCPWQPILMEQTSHFKKCNNCLNTNIYSILEIFGGQSYNMYLHVVHFVNNSVNQTSVAA